MSSLSLFIERFSAHHAVLGVSFDSMNEAGIPAIDFPLANIAINGQDALLTVVLTRQGVEILTSAENMDNNIFAEGVEESDLTLQLRDKRSSTFVSRKGFLLRLRGYKGGVSAYAALVERGEQIRVLGRIFHLNATGTLYIPEPPNSFLPPILIRNRDDFWAERRPRPSTRPSTRPRSTYETRLSADARAIFAAYREPRIISNTNSSNEEAEYSTKAHFMASYLSEFVDDVDETEATQPE